MTTESSTYLLTCRFGTVEYIEEDLVLFHHGLIGFPNANRFLLLNTKEGSPFRWLQSVDEPGLAFLVADPSQYVPSYAPELSKGDARELGLDEETPRLVYTTANIPAGKPKDMTLNLAGPLLINANTRHAKQIVLEDPAYTVKHRVFQQADCEIENFAA